MNAGVIIAIILALIGGGGIGGILGAFSGVAKDMAARRRDSVITQVAKDKEDREAFNAIIAQALSMMTFSDSQVKVLDTRIQNLQTAAALENQALRERIRVLEARVSELEIENMRLKQPHTSTRRRTN